MKNTLILFLIALQGYACTWYDHTFPYDFENVSALVELNHKMDEISGLFYKNDSTLYIVKDEEGEVFELDLTSGEHNKIFDFKKAGDFEGIAVAKDVFYILKSDGDIYKVTRDGSSEKFTFFDDDDDFEFEGLTYSEQRNSLIVACKNHGKKSKNDEAFLYEFALDKYKYLEKPLFTLKKKDIHENFKPSGISVAPNGNLFIISGVSNTIVEVTMSGKLVQTAQLPLLMYNQIEGICFDEESNMYISSERGNQDYAKVIFLERNNKIKKH